MGDVGDAGIIPRPSRCLAPTLADALHLAAARMMVRLEGDARLRMADRIAHLRAAEEPCAGRCRCARRVDVGRQPCEEADAARRAVLDHAGLRDPRAHRDELRALAASDHWASWAVWLRWLENAEGEIASAADADEVLRDCPVCSEVRLELLG
jgi:hypothetical protein